MPPGQKHESQTEAPRPQWSLRRRLLGLAALVIFVMAGAWLWTEAHAIREGSTHPATMTWIPNPCRNIDGNPVLGEVVIGDRRYWQGADQVPLASWQGHPVEGEIHILEDHGQPAATFEADGGHRDVRWNRGQRARLRNGWLSLSTGSVQLCGASCDRRSGTDAVMVLPLIGMTIESSRRVFYRTDASMAVVRWSARWCTSPARWV